MWVHTPRIPAPPLVAATAFAPNTPTPSPPSSGEPYLPYSHLIFTSMLSLPRCSSPRPVPHSMRHYCRSPHTAPRPPAHLVCAFRRVTMSHLTHLRRSHYPPTDCQIATRHLPTIHPEQMAYVLTPLRLSKMASTPRLPGCNAAIPFEDFTRSSITHRPPTAFLAATHFPPSVLSIFLLPYSLGSVDNAVPHHPAF